MQFPTFKFYHNFLPRANFSGGLLRRYGIFRDSENREFKSRFRGP